MSGLSNPAPSNSDVLESIRVLLQRVVDNTATLDALFERQEILIAIAESQAET